jgi:subtilase family serine protease
LAGALLLLVPGLAAAQGSVVRPRIAAQVDDSRLTELRGNIHPLARPQYDQGKVDPSFKLERITMMFQPTAAQQADLDALLAAQQNPTSPNFHQWLTPEQYADRFGIAQSDLDKVTAWLLSKGFTVVEIPRSRNWIVFSGTAAQVESALHSEVHNYTANGKMFYANSAEPSVPAAMAGVVLGFRGLNNFPLKPRVHKSIGASVQPNFTSSISGNHFVSPGDFATIYHLMPLYSGTPAIDGTGQKIVIVGQSNIKLADIATFRSLSGLPMNVPTVTLVPGSTDPGIVDGDVQEASIDIEWAGAVAKNATIIFVYSTDAFASLAYAIQQDLAPVMSVSYGACEPVFSTSDTNTFVAIAQQANAQGITIVSATGGRRRHGLRW